MVHERQPLVTIDVGDIYEDDHGDIVSTEALDSASIAYVRQDRGMDYPQRGDALDQLLENTLVDNKPVQFSEALKQKTKYHSIGKPRHFRDVIGVIRHLRRGGSESMETYDEKRLTLQEKGLAESAAFGQATLGGQDFTVFSSEMAYLAGTLGVSMGEQFVMATEHAAEHQQPLVSVFSSGGARQQESTPGLLQMPVMSEAVNAFREGSTMPNISIINESWGGISGSAATLGDIRVGIRGSKFGFAGPKVIDNYKGENNSFERKYQTVESNLFDGNIDMVFDSAEQTTEWLKMLMSISKEFTKDKHTLPNKIQAESIAFPAYYDRYPTGAVGIVNRINSQGMLEEGASRSVFIEPSKYDADYIPGMDTFDQYQMLLRNPHRPDTDVLMHLIFDTLVPLYSGSVTEEGNDTILRYPAIISAIGMIGTQPYLVTGNQPSYRFGQDGKPRLMPASPHVKNFQRRDEWLKMGARMGLPLVSLVSVLGANPDIPEERNGLSQVIANATVAGQSYPHPLFTYVTGTFGSGGGVASGPIGERFMMLEGAHMYVAAPVSSTVILYSPEDATTVDTELVKKTIHTSRVTAQDQLELGLIDGIIPEPPGGGQRNPFILAHSLKNDIVSATRKYRGVDRKEMHRDRREKLLRLGHHHLEIS